jgi:hypothetical protein
LIEHYRNGKDISDIEIIAADEEDLGEENDLDDEYDDVYSDDSPDKRVTGSGSKKETAGSGGGNVEKWEKNVKRRVYDALNVLYAAGVLRKDGKYVSCNPEAVDLTRTSSDISCGMVHEEGHEELLDVQSKGYDNGLMTEIEQL